MKASDGKSNGAAVDAADTGPGELLRLTREEKGVSVDDVAHALHLDPAIVHSLEAGNFELLGAPVFVKGHLRSYARYLGLSEQRIIDGFQASDAPPEVFRSLSTHRELKLGASLTNFIIWALLALVILFGVLYLLSDGDPIPASSSVSGQSALSGSTATDETGPARESRFSRDIGEFVVESENVEQLAAREAAELPPVAAAPAGEADMAPAAAAVPSRSVASAPEPEPAAEPAAENVSLEMLFSAECWVEVSDARRRLLYGLEKSGNIRRFDGIPPFRFFLGNVDAVSIKVAGADYSVPARVRTGRNTARFVVSREDVRSFQ